MNVPPQRIRLILDQGVPRDVAGILREAGLACEHVSELDLSRAEDTEILKQAGERQAVVVTLDSDFHAILAVSMATGPSVIRLRLQGLDAVKVASLVGT